MRNKLFTIFIITLSILTSIIAYFYLPQTVASHWNYLGVADGYSSKLFNLITFPALIIFVYILMQIVQKADPMQQNLMKFKNDLTNFITLILLFILVFQYQVLLWNLGIQIPFNIFFPITIGVLFFFMGDLLSKTKRNWIAGIRTPWTLSSDTVWDKTHQIGARLFKISLPIFLLSTLFANYSFIIVIGYLLIIIIILFIYSYLLFRKEKKA